MNSDQEYKNKIESDEQTVKCFTCGKFHALRTRVWLDENAKLIEVEVELFYYCPIANELVFIG